ncbi:Thiocyanate methyltransferase 1 [Gracilariopsis chorda]|uniref:Thiocyanate methyltransferase 1 n=1 Tax=Gracilariopsis chorda TaxID=448386 RepID=A0A2V3IMI8_9FLOR|nr:Thiocyanate methyltransferase 1 [Gracilariopsis chorda]|eukprot:PXF43295.1 Thiocyanate methyltransferase 1 [Gracilariopsis chorda]
MEAALQEADERNDGGGEWEELWTNGIDRGQLFDRMDALPELVRQLSNGGIERGRSVLIPGCGRGYDVEAFCNSGLFERVLGLDISASAVRSADEYLSTTGCAGRRTAFEVRAGDFFDARAVGGPFSVVYDYSFFCALGVQQRGAWAQRMRELVEVGGSLITAMYPVGKSVDEGGPPFGYDAHTLRQLLQDGAGGFAPRDGPRALGAGEAHAGLEQRTWWCRWQRV